MLERQINLCSFKDDKLYKLIKTFVSEAGYSGEIDIDIFDVNGEYYISEVNPRFGGGYPRCLREWSRSHEAHRQ